MIEDEKKILGHFIIDGWKYIDASLNDYAINLLQHKRILIRSSEISNRYFVFRYVIDHWSREFLTQHRDLLGTENKF